MAKKSSFKEKHREFQELAKELTILREHNKSFIADDPQDKLLLFAEAALVLVAFERFLRIILESSTTGATFRNLLEEATGKKKELITLKGGEHGRQHLIERYAGIRNALAHGNYEQRSRDLNLPNAGKYFKQHFVDDVEEMFQALDAIVKQIDPKTGKLRIPISADKKDE